MMVVVVVMMMVIITGKCRAKEDGTHHIFQRGKWGAMGVSCCQEHLHDKEKAPLVVTYCARFSIAQVATINQSDSNLCFFPFLLPLLT